LPIKNSTHGVARGRTLLEYPFLVHGVREQVMKKYQAEAKIFKMLMHPARLAILELLRDGEECVCHMEAVLGYRQAYISQHLAVLKESGLVEDRKDGWNSYYRVTQPDVFGIIDLALHMTGGANEKTPLFANLNQGSSVCSCPKCKVEA
jgi:DNA-binding transcriptional ArsR family regulator